MKVAVLDVGKTNVKAVIVDAEARCEIATRTIPNRVLTDGPYPHFDMDGIFAFFLQSLKDLNAEFGFDAISITAHGASGALLGDDDLALPVLDYEFRYPAEIDAAYDEIRPDFTETFSPRLPGGLNLGAQLHYQRSLFPEAFRRVRAVVTYPQYWGWRLTGKAATEVTSLGCHTDLWRPKEGRFSSLVERLDIGDKLAPVMRPSDLLGHVTEKISAIIGLAQPVPVHCGIHDSNASLLPHLGQHEAPFAVVSTGTWVVIFAVGGDLDHLDPTRDTLANVDALGRAVPSARFMGGREFELLTKGRGRATPEAIRRVLDRRILMTPSVVPGCGPFPDATHRLVNASDDLNEDETYVAASLYTAMMTQACLDLTRAAGPIIVEGPFARNALYAEALSNATGREVIAVSSATGTSVGAALLALAPSTPVAHREGLQTPSSQLQKDFPLYRAEWNAHVKIS
ncbi:FGGY-family carbohydrate kinase [Microvirga lotononidis]|uniref:Pentulose/hexulose kinase n=1 Tax=Microvirga lotononidis TaxID=864069 RepID=I4YVU3_9HYPH|nr:FGGY-family carbohydrate kinase [Microvirga lotononidis]EIM28085.1 pentulose/hexulose kinase [Microvirga lotononidis]WQO27808.1 FGGY-family carbohydrate kinase [Microvirga lotononidis]